ncbi:MAG TPA: hypothetical protein VG253_09370 [Streptosporangiaceae bacterium]|jgi:hypothetical protein|nr:hypothetical protein [Streptosporangiaceae bacterium]
MARRRGAGGTAARAVRGRAAHPFIDRLREERDEQIVVLIPMAAPDRLRYWFLHDHYDRVLAGKLQRDRPDVITARVRVPLHVERRS